MTASVRLRHWKGSRRVYAYLRYRDGGRKTVARYIGDVTAEDRETALRRAWEIAARKGLLGARPDAD